MTPRICAIIPTYNNPTTLETVVRDVQAHLSDVFVIDDGSDAATREVADALAAEGLAQVTHRAHNGGKGAAVCTGLEVAGAAGFSHAVQIDADGQHDATDLPRFLAAAREHPRALVLGQPIFDDTAPRARRYARKISIFWCQVETLSRRVGDPLCGYRVYPIAATLAAKPTGRMMDFDPEIAVRLAWAGLPIVHLPTRVRYFSAAEGGVSHYRGVRDTWLISVMHTRLCILGILHLIAAPFRRRLP